MFSTLGWILSWLPDSLIMWIFYGCAGLGLALILVSWFIWFIPLINRYRFPVQVIGVAAFGIGAFFSGGYGVEQMWRERVAEMEAKVKAAEEKSREVNTVIETRVVTKTKIIKEKGEKQIQYIDRVIKGDTVEITKDMSEEQRAEFAAKQKELEDNLKNCKVPKLIVEELNKAAETP